MAIVQYVEQATYTLIMVEKKEKEYSWVERNKEKHLRGDITKWALGGTYVGQLLFDCGLWNIDIDDKENQINIWKNESGK